MIFLQNKINSMIEKVLVDNSVGCHVCGKQVKHRDETVGTNYPEFRNFDLRLVKKFYSNVSIREVKARKKDQQARGILLENLSTGEVVPVSFSHKYLMRQIKYRENQDNSNLDIGFDLIKSVMKTLNEEQLQNFLENLYIDAVMSLKWQLGIRVKNILKNLSVGKFEKFNEYVKSCSPSDVQMEVKPMSYNNLDLFSHMEALAKYKNLILRFLSMKLLSWAKEWTDQNHGNIKRPCVECYLRKLEKTKGWDANTIKIIEDFGSMDIDEKAKKFT